MARHLEGIGRLPRNLRVAFSAACAERVLPIFEIESDEGSDAVGRAVALAWEIAMGAQVDDEGIREARSAVGAVMPDQDEEPGTTAALYAGQAVALALQSAQDSKAARGTANYARDAVESFADDVGAEEEGEWQERALALAESWGSRPVERTMFDTPGEKKPSWLVRQGR